MSTILSGIQPSGELHLGNYFGAISEHLRIDADKNTALFFIADYHALTSIRDPGALRQHTYDVAATYLALGLSDKAILFCQSHLGLAPELMWLLGCTTNIGLLNRAPAYKEKVEKGIPASMGLFSYPLLMAADILMFNSNIVPVGQDQIPHIDIARDVAISFNSIYGDIFTIPEHRLTLAPKVPGTDGEKMSKSYKNTIPIFAEPKKVESIIKSIKTTGVDFTREPMPTEDDVVFSLYSLMASPEEVQGMKRLYEDDRTFGYGNAKSCLFAHYMRTFGSKYDHYVELRKDETKLDRRLREDAERAGIIAQETMRKVREAMGLT